MVAALVSRTAGGITRLALAGAALASMVTLAWDGTYPPPFHGPVHNGILAEARGWSLVTLLWVVPLGLLALEGARRGSPKARVAWGGIMAYLVYTYLELAVSGPFTPLFLVYTTTLALSAVALVMAVVPIDVRALAADLVVPAPARIAAGIFAVLVSVGLALAWTKGIVLRMVTGDYGWPDAYGSVAQVVHALDLGLQVPLALAAGLMLLRNRPAAFVVGGVFLVMASTMLPALTAMVLMDGIYGGEGLELVLPFFVATLVALVLTSVFFAPVPDSIGRRAEVPS
jgi:hypothetical protein